MVVIRNERSRANAKRAKETTPWLELVGDRKSDESSVAVPLRRVYILTHSPADTDTDRSGALGGDKTAQSGV